jgi:hypothetical protein
VTIAKRPSCGCGMGRDVDVIWVKSEREYFCEKGWTGGWVICPSACDPDLEPHHDEQDLSGFSQS